MRKVVKGCDSLCLHDLGEYAILKTETGRNRAGMDQHMLLITEQCQKKTIHYHSILQRLVITFSYNAHGLVIRGQRDINMQQAFRRSAALAGDLRRVTACLILVILVPFTLTEINKLTVLLT